MLVVVIDVRVWLSIAQLVARVAQKSTLAEVSFAAVANGAFTHHAPAVAHRGQGAET